MMAAGTAAKYDKDVILLEKNQKLGRKLLITGKGRCNITSAKGIQELIDHIPVNGSFLYSAFYTFSNEQLINLLNNFGLKTKVERGDRVFPVSDNSRDVLQTLKKYLTQNEVKISKDEIKNIKKSDNEFSLITNNGKKIIADKVVIATGGKSYPATGSTGDGYFFAKNFGHTINSLYPSLVPLVTKEDWVEELQGLSLKNVDLIVYDENNNQVFKERGEMIFTHYGVSGPLVLSASSHLRNMNKDNYKIRIDLKPALSKEKLDNRVQRDFAKYSNKYFKNSLGDLLPSKLIPVITKLAKINYDKTVNQITSEERKDLVDLLKNLELNIKGYRPLDEAIVTSGGIEVEEIDPGTMESKLIDDLYFAGEVIDVDGYTGGFNLQIAFSTGYLAGLNL